MITKKYVEEIEEKRRRLIVGNSLPPSLLSIYVKVCEKMFYQSFELSKKIKNVNCPFWDKLFSSLLYCHHALLQKVLVSFTFSRISSFREIVISENRNHLIVDRKLHRKFIASSNHKVSRNHKVIEISKFFQENLQLTPIHQQIL